MPSRRGVVAGAISTGAFALSGFPARAQSLAEFYEGKTIALIVTGGSGGGYDLRSRLVSRHLGKHIPGNPKVNIVYMPGAGSVVGMNHVFNVAPKDGTVICSTQRIIFTTPWLAPDGVRFDLTRYNWLGNIGPDYGVVAAWHDSPIQTAADLFTKQMIVAGTGPFTMPLVLNALIGTKFKLIVGYKGVEEMFIATERGEVMGPGEASWSYVRSAKADLIRDKKIRIVLQNALAKAPDLPDVPLSRDYAKGDERRILDTFLVQRELAYPLVMPPDVPADRVAALRTAFMALSTDAEFKEDATKASVDFDLMTGEKVQKIVADIVAMPGPLIARLKTLTQPDAK
jgi:tripartite-type tricarboxylate transporter receptor subunit TctC